MTDRYRSSFDADTPNHPHGAAVRLVGTDQRVLEVGCWNGHVTEVLAARGNTVVGVDIDADELGRNEFLDRAHVADLDRVRLSEIEHERFDAIVLGDVIEHLRDPKPVLDDMITLLKPGGRLVISVPHVGHIDVRLHLLAGRWEYQDIGLLDRTHLRWFTRASLRELLASIGCVATRMETVVRPLGGSRLPLDTDSYPADAVRYIRTDPDAEVYQFVVEARRADEVGDDETDVLTPVEHTTIDFAGEAAEQAAIRDELEGWRNSRTARYTEPIRRLAAKLRR